jgi:hypothetical protein
MAIGSVMENNRETPFALGNHQMGIKAVRAPDVFPKWEPFPLTSSQFGAFHISPDPKERP